MLRLRDQQQNQLIRQGQLMPNQFAAMRGVRGNMVPANLQKSVLQNPQNMYVVIICKAQAECWN